jgi:hypothetical protein
MCDFSDRNFLGTISSINGLCVSESFHVGVLFPLKSDNEKSTTSTTTVPGGTRYEYEYNVLLQNCTIVIVSTEDIVLLETGISP